MPIQVDTWGGDVHQTHAGCDEFETWSEASEFMRQRIDEGHLCNVLHTDFKAPPERVAEQEAALAETLNR